MAARDPSCLNCGHRRHAHGMPGLPATFKEVENPDESMAESPPCMATVDGKRCPCVQFVREPYAA